MNEHSDEDDTKSYVEQDSGEFALSPGPAFKPDKDGLYHPRTHTLIDQPLDESMASNPFTDNHSEQETN